GLKPTFGVRRQELIVKEVSQNIVAERRRTYEAWRASRDRARRIGSQPSTVIMTARELAARAALEPAPAIPIVAVTAADHGPRGAAFGLLVHAVLADVPLDASAEVVVDVARQQGRALGAS